jgi:hypothetical protein
VCTQTNIKHVRLKALFRRGLKGLIGNSTKIWKERIGIGVACSDRAHTRGVCVMRFNMLFLHLRLESAGVERQSAYVLNNGKNRKGADGPATINSSNVFYLMDLTHS